MTAHKRTLEPIIDSCYPDCSGLEVIHAEPSSEVSNSAFDSSWAQLWPAILGNGDEDCVRNGEATLSVNTESGDVSSNEQERSETLAQALYPDFTATGDHIESWAEATIAPLVVANTCVGTTEDSVSEPVDTSLRCFGKIHALDARLIGDMGQLRSHLSNTKGTSTSLCVIFGGDFVSLVLANGATFAQLSERMKVPLQTICGIDSVFVKAFADSKSCLGCIEKARRLHDARIKVDVNVYGKADSRSDLGRILSAHKVYLQHPTHTQSILEYDNPHMLTFDDLDFNALDAGCQGAIGSSIGSKPTNSDDVAREVCLSETKDRQLEGMKSDGRVKTALHAHQEGALEFMFRKERGDDSFDSQLWHHANDDERPGFRHKVTGLWAFQAPPAVRSGVLADGTGMGKTLSILSLITRTLEDACAWAKEACKEPITLQRSRGTLIVLPSILMMNNVWDKEIANHLDGSLRVCKYHGKRRDVMLRQGPDADIVLTTYHTLAVGQKDKRKPLGSVEWYRVVLDEAHTIRRQSTTLYSAVASLHAQHRWCLTATPVQNKLEDFGTLLAFIRAEPLDHLSLFRKYVIGPFDDDVGTAKKRLRLLYDSFCLRRNKGLLNLPPVQERYHYVRFSESEKVLYEHSLFTMARALSHGHRHKYSGTPFGKFQIQLQLRLLCNHGTFYKPSAVALVDEQTQKEEMITSVPGDAQIVCSCCSVRTPLYATNCASKVSRSCHHIICDECELQFMDIESPDPSCRLCTPLKESPRLLKKLKYSNLHDQGSNGILRREGHSSKINALLEDVQERIGLTKSIIFSSWTRTLDLVASHLSHFSIGFVRIDGSTEMHRRQAVLDRFAADADIRLLLMTLGTGALGLNLTIANRIFILEPQWNPSVEIQAISRADRYLQTQNVQVVRYLVEDTVEEHIKNQQVRKVDIAKMDVRPDPSDPQIQI